ncbi:tyrosine-type recombinase/integrase [Nitrincola tibetensis]|nr:tyrosine-type recombinase/integrase [Nitrincola tibetensis]
MRVPNQDRVIQFSLRTYDPDLAREIAAKLAHDMKKTNKPDNGNSNSTGNDDYNNPPYDVNDPIAIMKAWMKNTYIIRKTNGPEEIENRRLAKLARRQQNQERAKADKINGKNIIAALEEQIKEQNPALDKLVQALDITLNHDAGSLPNLNRKYVRQPHFMFKNPDDFNSNLEQEKQNIADNEPDTSNRSNTGEANTPSTITKTDLTELHEEFCKRQTDNDEISIDTINDYREAFTIYLEYAGTPIFEEIDQHKHNRFVDFLRQLPKNKTKMPQYRDYSYQELSKMDIPKEDKVKPRTVNNKIRAVNRFFNYLKEDGKPSFTPIKELSAKVIDNESTKKLPFNKSHFPVLKEILTKTKCHQQKLIIKLLMLTGARVQEISQIELQDIKYEADILGIHITNLNDKGEVVNLQLYQGEADSFKGVKNISSKRFIPVPSALVEELLAFKNNRIAQKNGNRLFDQITVPKATKKVGETISRAFNRKLRNRNLSNEYTLHCLRHTFITLTSKAKVTVDSNGITVKVPIFRDAYIKAITGHHITDVHDRVYLHTDAEDLLSIVDYMYDSFYKEVL